MTEAEIAELFIQAAETEKKLPATGTAPAKTKSMSLPYVHSFADMNGWGWKRLQEEDDAFLQGLTTKLTTTDVSNWELCLKLKTLIPNERRRRCLSAWAKSKVGGLSFSKWCTRHEDITRQYGFECVKRAIKEISSALQCNPLQHNGFSQNTTLQHDGQIGDLSGILGDHDDEGKQPTHWIADGAKPLAFDDSLQDFTYYDLQKERRRKRDAVKRKAA